MIKTLFGKLVSNTVKMATSMGNAVREGCKYDDECEIAVGAVITAMLVIGAMFTHVFPSAIMMFVLVVVYASTMITGIINLVATISNDKPWLSWTNEFPAFIMLILIMTLCSLFFGFFAGLPLVFF